MDDDKQPYQIITLESGQQIVASVDPYVNVVVSQADDKEVDRQIVSLTDRQLAETMEAAKTNDIDSVTIQANKVVTPDNMQTNPTAEQDAE